MADSPRICSKCGYTNRPGKRFCAGCGTILSPICPSCGTENEPDARFCDECGSSLAPDASPTPSIIQATSTPASPSQEADLQPLDPGVSASSLTAEKPDEERRLVTALFCDLVGFTPLSERLDPEEVREIQAAYFGHMSTQIERFGGIVEKFAGDAVLALFGVPTAHEDDAERAVLCALAMQEALAPVQFEARRRWNVEVAIRVGLNTGEVVSGTWNASSHQELAVTGDAVNTAARIQAAAGAGEVVVGQVTRRLTQRRIEYGERRDLTLKGKSQPVPGYPALGLRKQIAERWEERQYTVGLVGRARELSQLTTSWQAVRAGVGQLVGVVGDAGVGKSRLIAELVSHARNDGPVRVLRGRCLSYGQQVSLWMVTDLLRDIFEIGEQDPPAQIRESLADAVGSLLVHSTGDARAELLDVVGEVFGLPVGSSLLAQAGAQARRQALVRGVRSLLAALTSDAPAILVLEDLHWIDEASQEILTESLVDVPGLQLLVMASSRPGWSAPWSDWGWPERLAVRALPDDEAARLAGDILGVSALSSELEVYVRDRAGGNPYFVEELIQALTEAGGLVQRDGQSNLIPGATDRLPSTLTEILLARLDRLDGRVKSLAQVASVIGRSFAVRLLAHVMAEAEVALEPSLTALQRAEIAFPQPGADLAYTFKHATMREVAYNTLLHKRRNQLHLQTARAIARLYPADEYVEVIAYHFSMTDEHREAAEWLERAGVRATAIYANDSAISHFQEALKRLEQIGSTGEALARVSEKLGKVLWTVGRYEEALEALERGASGYRQLGARERELETLYWVSYVYAFQGRAREGLNRLEPALRMAVESSPSPALASLHLAVAELYSILGQYGNALATIEKGVSLARASGDDSVVARAEMRRGAALKYVGRLEESRQVLESTIPIAERVGDISSLRGALLNLGESYRLLGDLEASRRHNERALELAEKIGDPLNRAFSMVNLGEILIFLGNWKAARDMLEQAWDVSRSLGMNHAASYPPFLLGYLDLLEGHRESAERNFVEAVSLAEETQDRQALDHAHTYWAALEVVTGQPRAAISRLAPLAAHEDARLALVLPVLAEAHLAIGDVATASDMAACATDAARSAHEALALVNGLRIQGMVWTRQEEWRKARSAFDEALDLARSMPCPYAQAQVLIEIGLLQRAQGSDGDLFLNDALTIVQGLGAVADVTRIERELSSPV